MNNRHSAILFGAGITGLTAGAVAAYVEQRLSVITTGLLLWGVVSLIFLLIRQGRASGLRLTLSRWKRAIVVLMAAVLSLGSFIAVNYFSSKIPWRWDVTRAKEHTLTAGTRNFIKGLDQEIRFSALYVGIPPSYLENLFREYTRVSNGMIKTEIIDPIEQIGYAAQFGNIINGQESKVVVRSGKERMDVDFTDSPLSEAQLTDAVVRVTREERQVCFATGHKEYSLSDKGDQGLTTLVSLLAANNMASREVLLEAEEDVPQDCNVLVVAGPHNDLTTKEEATIERYLKQGKAALFLVENVVVTTPDKPLEKGELHKNPSLNGILNQWGVKVEEDTVVDLASHASGDVGSPATRNYPKHKALTEGLDYTFYVRPRSITVLKDRRPSIKIAPIVMTSSAENSWGETDRTLQVKFDPILDTPGPIALAYVIMEDKKGAALPDTRIIIFTDADFLTNIYIDKHSNAQMGLNAISWLAETKAKTFVDTRNVKVERLDLTSKEKRMVVAILFLMPLLIAAGGIIVWLRR